MGQDQGLLDAARFILSQEARRDRYGLLRVYALPAGDGGGTFEVAGICDRHHPEMAARLKGLIESGRAADAESLAVDYIADAVAAPYRWSKRPGVGLFIADTAFNRGAGGAAWAAQAACGIARDGLIGPKTKAALAAAETDPIPLIHRLRAARETWERTPFPPFGKGARDEASPFWRGLVNRWNAALAAALKLEQTP